LFWCTEQFEYTKKSVEIQCEFSTLMSFVGAMTSELVLYEREFQLE